jgi:hypothetical protein
LRNFLREKLGAEKADFHCRRKGIRLELIATPDPGLLPRSVASKGDPVSQDPSVRSVQALKQQFSSPREH